MIKFQKFAVVDTATKTRARVHYRVDNRIDGRKCVTLYAKDYGGALRKVLGGSYVNNTDAMTDYFETGKAVLFEGHPLYAQAREFAEALKA
jgi:hypothetical protein